MNKFSKVLGSILAIAVFIAAASAIAASVAPATLGGIATVNLDAGSGGFDKQTAQNIPQAYTCTIATPGGVMNGQYDTGNLLIQVSNNGTNWAPMVYSGGTTQVDAGFTASDAGPYYYALVVPSGAPFLYQRLIFTGTLTAGQVTCQLSNL